MRIAFVLPRYGPRVLGGAETLGRAVIEQLVHRGHDVEVWTTCVQNLYTWTNEYPAGIERVNNIAVRRFPVEMNNPFDLLAQPLSHENQYRWVDNLPHSRQLYAHILAHGSRFDFLIFTPYAMSTTLYGAAIYPQRSVIWACLHDELLAYLEPARGLLASVVGLVLNTPAEEELLVNRLHIWHPRRVIAGMGFDIPGGDAQAFQRQYPQIDNQFLVYIGRLERGKNVGLLLEYFAEYRARHDQSLDLVLLGDGPVSVRDYPNVVPLGFVDETTKRNALAAATCLCQPSLNESFAIVLMEAWAQRRPVLVHADCPVTVTHVRQSGGGLYFANYSDFEGALDYFLSHPHLARQMGDDGYEYVDNQYNWQVVMHRLEQALQGWLEEAK
jgi:glycosyltransferase involved in cell wall biosynthesis